MSHSLSRKREDDEGGRRSRALLVLTCSKVPEVVLLFPQDRVAGGDTLGLCLLFIGVLCL